jgi:ABC-type Fe3+-hydroxamate transport system substrate-binding protein
MKPLTAFLACLCAAALLPACSRSNNLVEGRVESKVGTHTVVVTDCYRTSVPAPQKVEATTAGGHETYRFTPCRDADILISDEKLTVNGTSYGGLKPNDSVTVDHGRVLINEQAAQAVANR